jgi:hypothetical protein
VAFLPDQAGGSVLRPLQLDAEPGGWFPLNAAERPTSMAIRISLGHIDEYDDRVAAFAVQLG